MSDRSMLEMYQSFMSGYVKRINEASFNVDIGGVRIGSAKYTRLAQINLKSRIITFSRFAVENVPERGRRYLVLHELAHVKEASHNKHFWDLVARYEPSYRQVGKLLDQAFKTNVRADHRKHKQATVIEAPPRSGFAGEGVRLLASSRLLNYKTDIPAKEQSLLIEACAAEEEADGEDTLICLEDALSVWDELESGTINGGSDLLEETFAAGEL